MPVTQINFHPSIEQTFSRIAVGFWRAAQWQMSRKDLWALIEDSLELGITTFDHADIYGDYTCEGLFGDAFALNPSLRPQMQLVTKCGIKLISEKFPGRAIKHYDTSTEHILAAAERSLKNLHTDYLDLLLIHRPDPFMNADEVAAAFTTLRDAGKVRHFGLSNFTPSQFELLASRLDFPLITNQVEFSVMRLDPLHDGTFDQCQRLRISPMVWSPLGGGRLFNESDETARRAREALSKVGQMLDADIGQTALAWILAHPARIQPVLGTGKLERIRQAAAAASLQMTREQWFIIWCAAAGRDVP
jgi:predicted oxidoreductase